MNANFINSYGSGIHNTVLELVFCLNRVALKRSNNLWIRLPPIFLKKIRYFQKINIFKYCSEDTVMRIFPKTFLIIIKVLDFITVLSNNYGTFLAANYINFCFGMLEIGLHNHPTLGTLLDDFITVSLSTKKSKCWLSIFSGIADVNYILCRLICDQIKFGNDYRMTKTVQAGHFHEMH